MGAVVAKVYQSENSEDTGAGSEKLQKLLPYRYNMY